jgi:hypothetical protein
MTTTETLIRTAIPYMQTPAWLRTLHTIRTLPGS